MMPEMLSNILECQKRLEQQLNDVQKSLVEKSQSTQKELMTIDETCTALGVDRSTLYRWQKEGVIKSYGIEKRRYYKYSDIISKLKPL